jgi:predicted O-methyltransferase YrrM
MQAPTVIIQQFPESATTEHPFIKHGMSPIELAQLKHLIHGVLPPKRILEVGMANGTSSCVIAEAMGKGHLTSIDPYQTAARPQGYEGAGLARVAKLTDRHTLIEEFDYLALAQLAKDGAQFECILVDGFHSFDLTLLDFFYADKLLVRGGLLLCHDSSSLPVYKALRWLETNKPYHRLSPRLYCPQAQSLSTRLANAVLHPANRRAIQTKWGMLSAYRKLEDHAMAEHRLEQF